MSAGENLRLREALTALLAYYDQWGYHLGDEVAVARAVTAARAVLAGENPQ